MTVDAQHSGTRRGTRSGIDLSHVDPAIRPQDDLFGHVNGRWLAEHTIPADRAVDGAFRTLHDQAEEQVHDLIREAERSGAASGTDEQRIGDLYASFLDEATVEARGVHPLLEEIALIDDAADPAALAAFLQQKGYTDAQIQSIQGAASMMAAQGVTGEKTGSSL